MAPKDELVNGPWPSYSDVGRWLAKWLAAIVIVIAVLYLESVRNKEGLYQGSDAEAPFLVLLDLPAYTAPGGHPASGLASAVWDDGTIVRVASGSRPGGRYIKGQLSGQEVQRLKARVGELGLLRRGDDRVVLDAASVRIYLRGKNGFHCRAETPGSTHVVGVSQMRTEVLAMPVTDELPFALPWGPADLRQFHSIPSEPRP